MPYYSPERRAALLKMLLPPLNLSMAEVSRREGVSEMSLSNWRKQLSSEGSAVSENKSPAESWSAETKFAVVLEAAGLSEIDLGEYCRRKGLYPEQITAWRQAFITGQKSEKAQQKEDREQSRKDKKRIQELERELRRKDKALAETAALLVLRKKLNDYWGTDNEDN
ncbi:transposase ISAfe5 [Pseudomonas fluorescens HK44]|uniref:Transposase ISAfe5 n=1 Tax=Pseudomonas fluorescens HK44 TaxID=1042209 RepID=A0A010RQJ5_PSEFL|nr:transposase ISAfe5 [Pseudomonas fluorescens HK44]